MTDTTTAELTEPTEAAFLSKDAIFDVNDIETEDVYVPQWKGSVRVQALTGRERDRFEAELAGFARGGSGKKKNFDNFRARLVVASVIDPNTGALMFGQSDVAKLGSKSSAALSVIAEVAQRLSGLTDEDAEELAGE
jgi:hypothetical protein